jgi:hypothetical protein
MPNIVVRYRTKAERADENRQLVENVFAQLDEMGAHRMLHRPPG